MLISPSSPTTAPISTGAIVGVAVASVAFVSFLIGIGVFLCLRRRRSNKNTKGPPIDLGADEQIEKPRASPSIFSPFEYQHPASSHEVSDNSRESMAGARITGSPSSQALLFPFDPTAPPNNTQSTYSMYSSDDTTTSATRWAKSPARNSAVEPYPHFLTPPVPSVREKPRLVANNGPEGPSSPVSVNRLPSDAQSPPPYTARK